MADQPTPRANAEDRIARVVTTPWFRKTAPKILPPLHRAMKRLTGGRFVPGAGLVLTTTGAKTGARRDTPLEAVPCGDGTWVIVGSNFAQDHHPAWTTNLIAHPDTEILIRGRTVAVRAELLSGRARDEAWEQALAHFGGWNAYTELTDREFRIFRLTPNTASCGRCPNCGGAGLRSFYRVASVPTNSVLLLESEAEARSFEFGDIDLGFCATCGFASNTAFDPTRIEHSDRYEPTQAFSPTFNEYHRRLAAELIEHHDLRDKLVVEIGCGNGEFIAMLCEMGPNRGIGYDPSHNPDRGPDPMPAGLEVVVDFYSEAYRDAGGDFVVCKMTLEHVHQTGEFLAMVRRSISDDATVFFQVPNASYVFDGLAFWDVPYGHCSYFSAGSLARVFRRNGFAVEELETTYDDQHLTVVATPAATQTDSSLALEHDVEATARLVARFERDAAATVHRWKQRFADWSAAGKEVVLWGGGSKAVSFVTTLGLTDEILGAVDINPRKVGYFLAGSGHRILAPTELTAIEPDVVVVMNAVYEQEIEAQCHGDLGIDPEIVCL